ncbi:Zinc finger and BTB domain-containing protein 20, partial [Stegodyphus mimosarum]
MYTFTGEKLHVLGVRNQSFRKKDNIKEHLLLQSGKRFHVCEVCKKSFSQKKSLNRHLLIHTGE